MQYVTAPGGGPFDHIHDYPRFTLTPQHRGVAYLFEGLEQAAVSSGAELVLWGTWGEMGASCDGRRYFAELALRFRWLTLAHELSQLRSVSGSSPLRTLGRQIADVLPFIPGKRPLPYVLLTREFTRYGKASKPFRCHSIDQRRHQAAVMLRYRAGMSDQPGQTEGGHVRVGQPLGDKRVLEFCISAPPELKVRNGYQRCLIRAALDGILPKRIQWRTSKTPFSPDYYLRYNAQLGKAREFVAAIRANDPVRSVIDVPRLEKLLVEVPMGVRDRIARGVVPTTLYTICFLRQFAEFRP
jgi:hypothetical protein